MQPSKHSSSPPPHRSSSRPASRRVPLDRAPHRADHYEVEHRPRRVIPAGAEAEYFEKNPAREAVPRRNSLSKKLRRLRFGPWEWAGFAASLVACSLLLREIVAAQSDHQVIRRQLHDKQTQLAALEGQQREDEKKLAYLKSPKGREQILAERGYLKPGDRILLFPAEKPDETSTPKNAGTSLVS